MADNLVVQQMFYVVENKKAFLEIELVIVYVYIIKSVDAYFNQLIVP